MASRAARARIQQYGNVIKRVRLKIFPNSTGTPTWSARGGVASVADAGVGKFLITLQDPYRECVGFDATYVTSADNVDLYAQGGAVANAGTTSAVTAVVKLKTGASNTDGAATDPDNYISVCLEFEDSSATPGQSG